MISGPRKPWGNFNVRAAWSAAGLCALLLVSSACTLQQPDVPPDATPASLLNGSGSELRFGLVGNVDRVNVWKLFDSRGYTYNNYAVSGQYWPRLYGVSIPDQVFGPLAAEGSPEPVRSEGIFFTATIPVRTDLRWSDGSSLSAEDVVFTINTALKFELGYDWHDYYNPQVLDHSEAVGPAAVKFFFKQAPTVAEWQFGALQGPIVNEAFWSARVAAAAESLPPDALMAESASLRLQVADLQQKVNDLYAATFTVLPAEARDLQAQLKRQQGNLDEATNDLARVESEMQAAMDTARTALFAQDHEGEPLLGRWQPEASTSGDSTASYVNVANAHYPGPAAAFDRVVYVTFPTSEAAHLALERGDVQAILDLTGNARPDAAGEMTSPTRELRFLVLNTAGAFADASLRQALACVIDQADLHSQLGAEAMPLPSFVPESDVAWHDSGAALPCGEMDSTSRLRQAAGMLKSAGYTWAREPSGTSAGELLRAPDGTEVPRLGLLVDASDDLRSSAAGYIEERARFLGLPVQVNPVSNDAVNYAVFSTAGFDLAILGWKVPAYPGYLCDWFGPSAPFQYHPSLALDLCGQLAATSDLDAAASLLHQLQQALAGDVPMIPLYTGVIHESLRGISYPFQSIPGGLAGVFGAPELAFPAAPE
ncbi:MAG TPA: ABC transporter substrate-binding protein [Anaerolineales bacterium]